ncbi:Hsp20/alpha crystallin family protein [Halorussus halophilus]|uniref:Hsp20/alpha crystallin family protein n=1 Tax=Halorussus halophilus TaxID=2650975 RepID=UPI001CE43D5F|nr:Hsp20/alpha crystallin family protein [Halorussus halophilus]
MKKKMTRYDPFEEMDRMFEQMRTRMWNVGGTRGSLPVGSRGEMTQGDTSIDLQEREGEFVLVADLPGFEKEEIDLKLDDDTLTIAAEHEVEEMTELPAGETTEGEMVGTTSFARSRKVAERVTLPKEIEDEGITATYRNGVLEVHLPIAEEQEEDDSKKIDISD